MAGCEAVIAGDTGHNHVSAYKAVVLGDGKGHYLCYPCYKQFMGVPSMSKGLTICELPSDGMSVMRCNQRRADHVKPGSGDLNQWGSNPHFTNSSAGIGPNGEDLSTFRVPSDLRMIFTNDELAQLLAAQK